MGDLAISLRSLYHSMHWTYRILTRSTSVVYQLSTYVVFDFQSMNCVSVCAIDPGSAELARTIISVSDIVTVPSFFKLPRSTFTTGKLQHQPVSVPGSSSTTHPSSTSFRKTCAFPPTLTSHQSATSFPLLVLNAK